VRFFSAFEEDALEDAAMDDSDGRRNESHFGVPVQSGGFHF